MDSPKVNVLTTPYIANNENTRSIRIYTFVHVVWFLSNFSRLLQTSLSFKFSCPLLDFILQQNSYVVLISSPEYMDGFSFFP